MKHFEKKAIKQAQELGNSHTEKDLQKIDSNLEQMKKGRVAKIWDKVLFLWEKLKSPEIPLRLKVTIAGALLYLILPTDVVPDAIPGIGLIDDVSVILLVFKEVSKFVVPIAIEKTKTKFQESYYEKIEFKLKEIFFLMLLNSVISFVINITGIIILVLKPAGEYSKFIAIGIFTGVFIYTAIRVIRYFAKYGKVSLGIAKLVLKNKSMSKGVSLYVQETYPVITTVYAGINVAKKIIPGLDTIPEFDKIVKEFITHFRKKIITVVTLFVLYTLAIFITKLVVSF